MAAKVPVAHEDIENGFTLPHNHRRPNTSVAFLAIPSIT
jgi:hypothetical protein